ncbi:MAG: formylglycine-generating enzyme family protein [Deltaproteobacteria bacterium]|nr:formylglycine-generating enzyme family protein [Deltaproteobacteria bacterium]
MPFREQVFSSASTLVLFVSITGCGAATPREEARVVGVEEGLVEVAAQTVVIGSPEGEVGRDEDEGPLTEVVLSRFFVDRTPVTVAQLEARWSEVIASEPNVRVVREDETPAEWVGRCNVGSARRDHPATCVSIEAARAFCSLRGMDLPTEAEREAFARGGERAPHWWGETFDETHVVSSIACGARGCRGSTEAVVTSGPRCNALGVCDVAGNVWEWTLTEYVPAHGLGSNVVPETLSSQTVIRGASWLDHEPRLFRSAMRGLAYPDHGLTHIGFRCVRRG